MVRPEHVLALVCKSSLDCKPELPCHFLTGPIWLFGFCGIVFPLKKICSEFAPKRQTSVDYNTAGHYYIFSPHP